MSDHRRRIAVLEAVESRLMLSSLVAEVVTQPREASQRPLHGTVQVRGFIIPDYATSHFVVTFSGQGRLAPLGSVRLSGTLADTDHYNKIGVDTGSTFEGQYTLTDSRGRAIQLRTPLVHARPDTGPMDLPVVVVRGQEAQHVVRSGRVISFFVKPLRALRDDLLAVSVKVRFGRS